MQTSKKKDKREALSKSRIAALKPIPKGTIDEKTGEETTKIKSNAIFDAATKAAVPGLLVRCQPNGKKSFYYQFRRPAYVKNRKTGEKVLSKHATTRVCLGLVDGLTIQQAREKARIARDAAKAAIRADLTDDNVVMKVHEALNNLTEPAKTSEARQEAKRRCPSVERFIDDEYIEFQRSVPELKTFQDSQESDRLKYILSVLSRPPKKRGNGNKKIYPELNLLTKKLDEIDNALIRKWTAARRKRPSDKTGKPLSKVTIERERMMMRTMFNFAIDCKYIKRNPLVVRVGKHRRNKRKQTITSKDREGLLTESQEQRLLDALASREDRIREKRRAVNEFAAKEGGRMREEFPENKYVDFLQPVILIAMNTGLRFGEIASLKWEDVHLKKDNPDETRNYLMIWDPKNGRDLEMPLNPDAVQVLQTWKSWPGKNVVNIKRKKTLVFANRKGNKLASIRRYWKPVFCKADLPTGYRFHDLRHHFASKLVSMGKQLFAVQVLLNHSSPKMTERYAKHAPEYLESVVNSLSKDST